ncbi:DNA-binding response regulator [Bifidobacterium sp. DSM 109958]|uniref:DNA-binding response regulator n=1 Tax=Bifidobacterium moraviense TaxID=2675323 RepID=A0A7Y0F1J4_9BIFI|nr:response regulator transcription factor [Bifidobacterium sp. DSM 109958]NMN00315.1 DNA-binding response regulator [Bifidobacterium sp. DSM 109958]
MDTQRVTLGIVDNDPFALRMLAELFRRSSAPIAVRWAAQSGLEALSLCEDPASLPQVVLTDMSMPVMDGVRLSAELHARHPGTAVVGMTAFRVEHTEEELRRAGMVGVVYKERPTDELIRVIGSAVGNETLMRWGGRAQGASAVRLTETELTILRLYAAGLTVKAVARRLGRSETTVKTHMRSIYAKLGVNSRAEAVAYCVREGLID